MSIINDYEHKCKIYDNLWERNKELKNELLELELQNNGNIIDKLKCCANCKYCVESTDHEYFMCELHYISESGYSGYEDKVLDCLKLADNSCLNWTMK